MARRPLHSMAAISVVGYLALAACSETTPIGQDFDTLPPKPFGGTGGNDPAGIDGGTGAGTGAGGRDGGPSSSGGDAAATCAVTTFVDAFVPLRTLYVAPTGNDTNDGLSPTRPWRSLANTSQLRAGDLLSIAAGSYPCDVSLTVKGTAAAPVVLRATDGAGSATLECTLEDFGMQIFGASYLAVDGLAVRGAREDGVRITTPVGAPLAFADHILIKNSTLTKSGGSNLRAIGVSSLDLFTSEVSFSEALGDRADGQGQGVDLVAVRGARLLGNRIHDIPTDIAVQAHGGADAILVDGNDVHDVAEGFRLGGASPPPQWRTDSTADYEARNVTVANNRIWGSVAVGLSVYGCASCLASNNTLSLQGAQAALRGGPGHTGPSAADRDSHTSGFRVLNNILAFEPPRPARIFDLPETESTDFLSAQNLVWVSGATVGSVPSAPPVRGPGVLVDRDPRFVDAASGDLRPGAGSAALGAGTYVGEVARDATGACRSTRNIGAY